VVAAAGRHLGQSNSLLRHLLNIVQCNRLGHVLNNVENVIHAADQLMNFIAVKWGNEGLV
jgi:hypothetical protein